MQNRRIMLGYCVPTGELGRFDNRAAAYRMDNIQQIADAVQKGL